jgi:hypothetical protein
VANDWYRELSNPDRYVRQFDYLHHRYSGTHRIHSLSHHGVSFWDLVPDRRRFSRMIARAIEGGTYSMAPARVKQVWLDKPRDIFYFEALDFVVHGVMGDILCDAIDPMLAPSVYSYRRGVSSWKAVCGFASYVRAHCRAHADVKKRGLYVFRSDVNGYIESIPLGAHSPLWPMLKNALGESFAGPRFHIVEQMLRPEIVADDGSRYMRCRGIPLGSAVATQALNLYLSGLDHRMEAIASAFYVRFGDDILFAHEDPGVVEHAIAMIRDHLRGLQLELQESKERLYWFNGAGRKSAEWPEARGSQTVVFVGCAVRFDGTITLPNDKARHVLVDLKQRIRRTVKLLCGAPMDDRASALVAVVNQCLDPSSPFATRHAPRLRALVTCRRQLEHLDHLIALMIAEALTGRRGVRAFRTVSRCTLRERYELVSLVAKRNGAP